MENVLKTKDKAVWSATTTYRLIDWLIDWLIDCVDGERVED